MQTQRKISLLGSTGSVGRQTLEVAGSLGLRVAALSGNTNVKLLEEQTRRFRPTIVAVTDRSVALDLKARLRDIKVRVASGPGGLTDAACVDGADTVVTAVTGVAGLLPTLAAIKLGRRIALANKETLVCAGALVMKSAKEHRAEIIPVDSEHSAIFQCLHGESRKKIKKLILTASGGPFRGMTTAQLRNVTPEMALNHPNWKMGPKITVDSATLMNKGLEYIEAMHLFYVPPEKISIVIHPESIIHSMVEFVDNCVIAQMSTPDMRLPVQYALTYPQRLNSLTEGLDFMALSSLTFEEPDMDAFKCLGLALKAAKMRGTACAVLNAANEAAVAMFLHGEIGFCDIYRIVGAALERIPNKINPSLDDIISAGEEAKRFVTDNGKE